MIIINKLLTHEQSTSLCFKFKIAAKMAAKVNCILYLHNHATQNNGFGV